MIRVLHMIASLDVGGSQTMMMNIYRKIDRDRIQFDFVIDRPEETYFAAEIRSLGGRVFTMPPFRGTNAGEIKRDWNNFFYTHPEYHILHSHVRSYASLYLPVAREHGVKTIIHSHSTSTGGGVKGAVTAVPHRMEYICTKNGVKYYNDSKATNPDSVIKAMEVATPPVVLIAGGFDRHADYREMVESFRGIVRSAILLGTTAKDIADAINLWYPVPTAIVDTMEEAVKLAAEQAREGETVLLSPACASWDMYPNFEVRGDEFRQLALKL